jgi:hypothetical protein
MALGVCMVAIVAIAMSIYISLERKVAKWRS